MIIIAGTEIERLQKNSRFWRINPQSWNCRCSAEKLSRTGFVQIWIVSRCWSDYHAEYDDGHRLNADLVIGPGEMSPIGVSEIRR